MVVTRGNAHEFAERVLRELPSLTIDDSRAQQLTDAATALLDSALGGGSWLVVRTHAGYLQDCLHSYAGHRGAELAEQVVLS